MSGGLYFSHPGLHRARPAPVHAQAPGHARTADRLERRSRSEAGWDGSAARRRPRPRRSSSWSTRPATCARSARCAKRVVADRPGHGHRRRSSWPASLHAAGGAVEMARALLAGEAPVGYSAAAPVGPPRRTRSRDGLLPVRQRRRRRGPRDRRARASRACSCSTGMSTTATARPRSSGRAGRAVREPAPVAAVPGDGSARRTSAAARARATRSTSRSRRAPGRGCGWSCSSGRDTGCGRAFEPRADPRLGGLRRPSREDPLAHCRLQT